MPRLEQRQHGRAPVAPGRPQCPRSRFETSNVDDPLDDRLVEHVLEPGSGQPATQVDQVRVGVVAGMSSTVVTSQGTREVVVLTIPGSSTRAGRAAVTSSSSGGATRP